MITILMMARSSGEVWKTCEQAGVSTQELIRLLITSTHVLWRIGVLNAKEGDDLVTLTHRPSMHSDGFFFEIIIGKQVFRQQYMHAVSRAESFGPSLSLWTHSLWQPIHSLIQWAMASLAYPTPQIDP